MILLLVRHFLVTGGCGFIGSAFIRKALSRLDISIYNLDSLTYAAQEENLSSCKDHPLYHFFLGDIRDKDLISVILQKHPIDTVVHFAAESHVDRSIASARPFLETNVEGTLALLEEVARHPHIHFHHVSTDEVYGALGKEGKFSESSPYRPNSPYAASKAASDHFVRAFAHTYGLFMTISHCSNNYGPGQHREKLLPKVICSAKEGTEIPIYGKGLQVRDWLFVEDHVDAIFAILEKGRRGETYDIGGGEEKTNLEMVHLVLEELSRQTLEPSERYLSLCTFVADRPGHDFRYAIDSSKIENSLGWKARVSLREGLARTVAWYSNKILVHR